MQWSSDKSGVLQQKIKILQRKEFHRNSKDTTKKCQRQIEVLIKTYIGILKNLIKNTSNISNDNNDKHNHCDNKSE